MHRTTSTAPQKMPSFRKLALCTAYMAAQAEMSVAFTPQQTSIKAPGQVKLAVPSTSSLAAASEKERYTYGERSREFRRTVYSHDDWVKHRSPDRFYRNLSTIFYSGVSINLAKEVISTTSFAACIIGWNMIFGEYQDLDFVKHPGILHDSLIPVLSLPLSVFSLASPSLGLLLAFRTNQSYKRWDEARKNWGMNINHTRDLVRLGTAYYDRSAVSPQRAEEDLNRLALCTWAFVRSMKRHLSPEWEDEDAFKKEMLEKLPQEQAEAIFAAAHRPNRALQDLSQAIENLPMSFIRRNEVHAAATIFEDNLGSSERLLTSPIPLFYSRQTARFLFFWLLMLPLGLWGPLGNSWNHLALLPTIWILATFLFGIEELGTQLEEPFTILPMQAFCDKIYNWCFEIVGFKPGDNGMPVYYYDNYNLELSEGVASGIPLGAVLKEAAPPLNPPVLEAQVVE